MQKCDDASTVDTETEFTACRYHLKQAEVRLIKGEVSSFPDERTIAPSSWSHQTAVLLPVEQNVRLISEKVGRLNNSRKTTTTTRHGPQRCGSETHCDVNRFHLDQQSCSKSRIARLPLTLAPLSSRTHRRKHGPVQK